MMNNDKIRKILRSESLENQVLKTRKFISFDKAEFASTFNKIDNAMDRLGLERDFSYMEKREKGFGSGVDFYKYVNSDLKKFYSFDDSQDSFSSDCCWDVNKKDFSDLAFRYRICLTKDYFNLVKGVESSVELLKRLHVDSSNVLNKKKDSFLKDFGKFYSLVDSKFRSCESL